MKIGDWIFPWQNDRPIKTTEQPTQPETPNMTHEQRAELQEHLNRTRRTLSDLCDLLTESCAINAAQHQVATAHASLCAACWYFERWSKQQDENERMEPRP